MSIKRIRKNLETVQEERKAITFSMKEMAITALLSFLCGIVIAVIIIELLTLYF